MNKLPPNASELSDEQQAEWIRLMKLWEAENPIDKAGRYPKPLGVVAGVTLFFALLLLRRTDGVDLVPMAAVPFGYLIFFLTNRRFKVWDQQRQAHSQKLIDQLSSQQ
jgi:hypothetical protein